MSSRLTREKRTSYPQPNYKRFYALTSGRKSEKERRMSEDGAAGDSIRVQLDVMRCHLENARAESNQAIRGISSLRHICNARGTLSRLIFFPIFKFFASSGFAPKLTFAPKIGWLHLNSKLCFYS